jgi:hypothetical protein
LVVFRPTPLKNDGVRQWEGWHPIYVMENKIPWFQTTRISSDITCHPILPRISRANSRKHRLVWDWCMEKGWQACEVWLLSSQSTLAEGKSFTSEHHPAHFHETSPHLLILDVFSTKISRSTLW